MADCGASRLPSNFARDRSLREGKEQDEGELSFEAYLSSTGLCVSIANGVERSHWALGYSPPLSWTVTAECMTVGR